MLFLEETQRRQQLMVNSILLSAISGLRTVLHYIDYKPAEDDIKRVIRDLEKIRVYAQEDLDR